MSSFFGALAGSFIAYLGIYLGCVAVLKRRERKNKERVENLIKKFFGDAPAAEPDARPTVPRPNVN